MARVILVTGGARSGKSSFAESLLKEYKDVTYIATMRICDDEMKSRVERHKSQRQASWDTYEGCYNLNLAAIKNNNILLDCLTVMTSNIMFDITGDYTIIDETLQTKVEDSIIKEIESLVSNVIEKDGKLVIVTNEVGYSIVPENHVARVFRDIAGRVNRRVGQMANEVYIVVCGIPLRIK